jgi:Ssp1 endopeptidase immunity protein Rap1a
LAGRMDRLDQVAAAARPLQSLPRLLTGKIMRTLMCVLVALGLVGTAEAGDGNKLLEICNYPEGSLPRANCLGYVVGVAETVIGLDSVGALKMDGSPCVPDGATPDQLADVVVEYLTENPKNRNGLAAGLVGLALLNAWPPCNKREK